MSDITTTPKRRKRRVSTPPVDSTTLKDAYKLLAKVSHTDIANGNHETMVEINTKMEQFRELQSKPFYLGIALDDSGSMKSKKRQAIKAYNGFLSSQRFAENMVVSLRTFHSVIPVAPLEQIQRLTRDNYSCYGNTPLYDTIAQAIFDAEAHTSNDVIIFIITDGEECSSVKWRNPEKLKELIQSKLNLGWQFIYASCSYYVTEHARRIGIPRESVTSWHDLQALMGKVSRAMLSYRMGEVKQITFANESD